MSALPLDTPAVDVSRLVEWNPTPYGTRYRVGSGDKRAGQTGTMLGTIGLKHAPGYAVVLQMDNGKVESFMPMSLFPEVLSK